MKIEDQLDEAANFYADARKLHQIRNSISLDRRDIYDAYLQGAMKALELFVAGTQGALAVFQAELEKLL